MLDHHSEIFTLRNPLCIIIVFMVILVATIVLFIINIKSWISQPESFQSMTMDRIRHGSSIQFLKKIRAFVGNNFANAIGSLPSVTLFVLWHIRLFTFSVM